MQSLALQDVNKSFGALRVLANINLEIGKGEFGAIVGPSGCGKSTLIRMFAGLEHPDSGQVLADGQSIEKPDARRTLIFQEHALYPWRTVEQNVGFGLELQSVPKAERKHRVQAVLAKVGLDSFAAYYPHQLSGGMQQRVSIARALVLNPDVLLLDEPYGALDAITRAAMQNELLQLWRGSGKTVLLITHDIEEALYLADKVFVMGTQPGRVIKTIQVRLDRPRNRSAAQFTALRQQITDCLNIGF